MLKRPWETASNLISNHLDNSSEARQGQESTFCATLLHLTKVASVTLMCTSQSRFLLQLDTHHLNFFLFKVRKFFDICVLPNVKLGIKWGCWATYKFMLVNCKKGFRYKSSIQGIQIVQYLCFTLLLCIKFYVAHDHGDIGNLI